MASAFVGVDKLPVWQKLAVWVVVAAAIAAGFWLSFYVDAVEAREGAERGLTKATGELERLEKRRDNFLEEQREHEAREAEFRAEMEVLPMNASTVDNLMQTFQQKARQVGMSFDSWTNEAAQRQDFYERLPVKVKARGTWPQIGEFFRQLAELKQILSVENLSLAHSGSGPRNKAAQPGDHPVLEVAFEAATYRFLSEQERTAAPDKGTARREPSRRKGASR
jgi:type IV pilus assembly protein PilO